MFKHDEKTFELEKHERIITKDDTPEQYHYKIFKDGKEIDDVQAIVRVDKEALFKEANKRIGEKR